MIKKLNATETEQLKWIYKQVSDMKENDLFEIVKTGETVTFVKNKKEIAKKKSQLISKAVFYPWLGEKPIDSELKAKLLGNKKG